MKFRPPARLRRLLRTQEFLALCDDTARDIQSRIRWDEQSGDSRQSARDRRSSSARLIPRQPLMPPREFESLAGRFACRVGFCQHPPATPDLAPVQIEAKLGQRLTHPRTRSRPDRLRRVASEWATLRRAAAISA